MIQDEFHQRHLLVSNNIPMMILMEKRQINRIILRFFLIIRTLIHFRMIPNRMIIRNISCWLACNLKSFIMHLRISMSLGKQWVLQLRGHWSWWILYHLVLILILFQIQFLSCPLFFLPIQLRSLLVLHRHLNNQFCILCKHLFQVQLMVYWKSILWMGLMDFLQCRYMQIL